MIHLGDITKLKGNEIPVVDIITGGSPCQDLSVAGKRAGLAGERSGLFMEQIRIIKEMRENDKRNRGSDVNIRFLRPRFMVWENVLGAFSSNGGEDFRAVLEETAKVAERDASIPQFEGRWPHSGCILGNGWSIAWRVHDAQFWGVPQRRKRIALVADFGGEAAPKILFESESMSGNFEESGEERKESSRDIGQCAEETSGNEADFISAVDEPITADKFQQSREDGIANMLVASDYKNPPIVCQEPTTASKASFFSHTHSDGTASTLVATDYKDPPIVCYDVKPNDEKVQGVDFYNFAMTGNKTKTLNASATDSDHVPCVVVGEGGISQTVGALCARDYKGVGTQYVEEGKLIIEHIRSGNGD